MSDRIKEGDLVNIYFERLDAIFSATVLHTPCATGDAWRLRLETGDLMYVQNFNIMERLNTVDDEQVVKKVDGGK